MSPIDQAIEATARRPFTVQVSLLRGIEYALALLLFAAACLKTSQLLNGSKIAIPIFLGHRAAFAALIQAELLLALWLLFGGLPRPRLICAVACFAVFAAASCYEAAHAIASCGCFGNVKVPPAITAALDIAAVLALCLTRTQPIDHPSRRRLILAASTAILSSAALWTIYSLHTPAAASASPLVIEPNDWLNKPFTLLDELPRSAPLRSGRWMLLIYHDDCDDCRQAIPIYRAAHGSTCRLALLALPPITTPATDWPDSLRLTLNPDQNWFATTPLAFALQDGRVLASAAGHAAMHPPDVIQWRHDLP
jgi:hypothetical protein